jgi:V/A-type H+/Na+-transporting ATPase subunit E
MSKPETEISHLDVIIEKIRCDGILAAETEGLKIKSAANAEAEKIIAGARNEAQRLLSDAEKTIRHKEEISRNALAFAARDAILMVRSHLETLFKGLIRKESAKALDESLLKAIILKLIDHWVASGLAESITLKLSNEDHRNLGDVLNSAITAQVRSGLEISSVPGLKAGFRISKSGEHCYLDISDESVAETLMFFLSSEIKTLLDPRMTEKGNDG